MAELIEAVVSWPSLLLVLVVFGFAPGFCLRLIVLAYPRGDPRRAELIAELYAVPRSQRPLWVVEQLEVALFEGLAHRVSAALRRRRARAQTDERGVGVRMRLPFEGGFLGGFVGGLVGGLGGLVVGGFVAVGEMLVSVLVGGFVGVLTSRFMSRRRPDGRG